MLRFRIIIIICLVVVHVRHGRSIVIVPEQLRPLVKNIATTLVHGGLARPANPDATTAASTDVGRLFQIEHQIDPQHTVAEQASSSANANALESAATAAIEQDERIYQAQIDHQQERAHL